MFQEALKQVVEGSDGGVAGLVMDFEGIPLATYKRESSTLDIEAVGAEISVIVKSIQRASEMLEAGAAHEVAIRSDKMVTIVRVLNSDYFLALSMDPDGNLGKGRFMLRVAAPKIVSELEV